MIRETAAHRFPSNPSLWLRERFAFDSRARSPRVEAHVLDEFAGLDRLRILDLGAGLGANVEYYGDRFSCDQDWQLREPDDRLSRPCLARLRRWAWSRGARCLSRDAALEIRLPGRRLSVRLDASPLNDFPRRIAWEEVDLVTANALFDQVPLDQLVSLVYASSRRRVPILATLNYESLAFDPEGPEDAGYIALYHDHMTRSRPFGRAMGPYCAPMITSLLLSRGYTVCAGESLWVVSGRERSMFRFLLEFLRRALAEMSTGEEERRRLRAWLLEKNGLARAGAVRLVVRHTDIFGRI